MSRNPFNRVGKLKPRRNVFDLSYRKNFTCDMGQLIPVMCDEFVPGDYVKIGNQMVVRFQPLNAPIMHEISAHVHYFFVPYRILWDEWENFISQGQTDVEQLPIRLPRFETTLRPNQGEEALRRRALGTLWDFFGLPIGPISQAQHPHLEPMDMPWRAYNRVWNEYYRDQDLQLEVNELQPHVLNRSWKKDYFTSARPFLQKGQPPALPVNTDINGNVLFGDGTPSSHLETRYFGVGGQSAGANLQFNAYRAGSTFGRTVEMTVGRDNTGDGIWPGDGGRIGVPLNALTQQSNLNIDAVSTSFNVSDLRLAFRLQEWMERNARAGTRYTEFLQSHFGVSPSDARLNRPEYIGGTKMPVIISEVLQTSESNNTAQGTMTGHGLAADGQFAGSYNVQEYGIIIGIMSVMPKPSYQDGINRQWLRYIPTDFYFPEFAHLSEQAIFAGELFMSFGRLDDHATFGYTGQYDEMRIKHDMVCSEMRKSWMRAGDPPDLSHWNLTRKFTSPPLLNTNFITCVPRKDIFSVEDVPGLIVNCQNIIQAVRPLPLIAEPGLIDHF